MVSDWNQKGALVVEGRSIPRPVVLCFTGMSALPILYREPWLDLRVQSILWVWIMVILLAGQASLLRLREEYNLFIALVKGHCQFRNAYGLPFATVS